MSLNYKQKYHKYKNKYIQLKGIIGGIPNTELIKPSELRTKNYIDLELKLFLYYESLTKFYKENSESENLNKIIFDIIKKMNKIRYSSKDEQQELSELYSKFKSINIPQSLKNETNSEIYNNIIKLFDEIVLIK
jgi:hypothetical protein